MQCLKPANLHDMTFSDVKNYDSQSLTLYT
jgi:hypothetical protein